MNKLIWWWSIDLLPKPTQLPKWVEKVTIIIALPVMVYLIIKVLVLYLNVSWLSGTISLLLIIGIIIAIAHLGEKAGQFDPKPTSISDRKIEIYTSGIKYNLFSEYTNTAVDFYPINVIDTNTIKVGLSLCSINGGWGLTNALVFGVNYMEVKVKLPLFGMEKKETLELKQALNLMKEGNT